MSNKHVVFGAGGVIIGLLAGVAVGGAVSESRMAEAIGQSLTPAQEASAEAATSTQEALARLEERLGTLEQAVNDSKVDPDALTEGVRASTEGMSAKLDEMQTALSTKISDTAKSQTEAMKTALADISSGIEESARIAASAVASAGGGGGSGSGGDASSEAMSASETAELSEAMGVGQTAIFADGALRVFVSRLDAQSGSARLSINGEPSMLGAGGTTEASVGEQTCAVSVMALTDEGVTLGSDCKGAAQQQAAASEAPENGMKPGNVVSLADGAVRVFLSSVDDENGMARIAVNGVSTQSVAVGDSVDVTSGDQNCTVTVTGIGQGQAAFEATCG
ncbi:hypothetical protein CDO87_17245 [Sagittula sp. P11]|uniref:hypothetical protein n=1 Tax=Sagittula sp. P11 TaxID=2009329 RepID=UPI000C2D5F16|nr:hypothetical protein [Sagittula sp. P11]AUC54810.1 hypothetical protein CDO87_17245 [Sagittula sp. P11]